MRLAYLDLFAGISGDMFLGSLVDSGLNPVILHNATAAMNLGATLSISKVDRSGITSTKVDVIVDGKPAEELPFPKPHIHTEPYSQTQPGSHTQPDSFEHQQPSPTHTHQPKTQHLHKTGQPHTHESLTHPAEPHVHPADGHPYPSEPDTHPHGRSLTAIRELIRSSSLASPVKHTAIRIFELLGFSEAKIHNVPVDQIHFHEVGAVDAIVDIVCASAGIHALAVDRWYASSINTGGGMVDCAHGRFPVPAPATADLLRGLPTYSADIQKELVTPTGAAILRTLVEDHGLTFLPQPPMRIDRIGYGAGTRNPPNFPNVLRLSLGDSIDLILSATSTGTNQNQAIFTGTNQNHASVIDVDQATITGANLNPAANLHLQTVTVLETALDDLSPQVLAYVCEQALAQGALDIMLTSVVMKKGRPGTLLTLLSNPADAPRFETLLLRETSTLGVRIRNEQRACLERIHLSVSTPYGPIRIKLGQLDGQILNAAPEYEDCRRAAQTHAIPLKQVHQAALSAYHASVTESQISLAP